MSTDRRTTGTRLDALAREAVITAEVRRSASVTLADRALIVTAWDQDAETSGTWDEDQAKAIVREALEIAGLLPCEPGNPPKPPRGCAGTIVSYQRPGRSA